MPSVTVFIPHKIPPEIALFKQSNYYNLIISYIYGIIVAILSLILAFFGGEMFALFSK
jgi:hypothetical protein